MLHMYIMICEEILKRLEVEYPPSCAEEWDNPGLLVGRRSGEVRRIFVALDVTDETLEDACSWGADLMVTHHPLIFGSIRQVNEDTFIGRRILKLIEHRMSYYAMHTNFDVRGMAELNERQLGLVNARVLMKTGDNEERPEGIGRIGELAEPMALTALAEHVKTCMGVPDVRCYGASELPIARGAVCGGAGKSVVQEALDAGAEALVTGDIDYHTAIDALSEGLHILDAGHYGTEYCFISYMTDRLSRMFPECQVKGASVRMPYTVI